MELQVQGLQADMERIENEMASHRQALYHSGGGGRVGSGR